ncbi:Uncharacterized protein Fot_08071 [Forsythia ovata]|uniref:Uncharacterized protein n=1 Tax=Forsythia ovata TaxID=205694 RepID=A0ABD1WXM8_9LAMI
METQILQFPHSKNIPIHQNVSGFIYQQLVSVLGINCKGFAVEPHFIGAEKQEIIVLLTARDLEWNIMTLEQNVRWSNKFHKARIYRVLPKLTIRYPIFACPIQRLLHKTLQKGQVNLMILEGNTRYQIKSVHQSSRLNKKVPAIRFVIQILHISETK